MKSQAKIIEASVPGTNGGAAPVSSPVASVSSSAAQVEFQNLLADIEDLVKDATSLTSAELAQAKAALNARLHAAKESVQHMSNTIAAQAREAAKTTDAYVHEHPWQAIGLSAAVGLLLGAVIARRQ